MNTNLNAEARSSRGKNLARALRRSGRVPGVVYGGAGGNSEAVALSVDPAAISKILRSDSGVNTLIGLSVDTGNTAPVLIKDYQLNPISHQLLHVDFLRVAMDKVLTVTIPVELTGEAEGVKLQGGLIDFVHREIDIECLPGEIPEHVTVDITPLTIGQGIRVRDLLDGVSWQPVTDIDTLLVHVIASALEAETTEDEEGETAVAAGDKKADV